MKKSYYFTIIIAIYFYFISFSNALEILKNTFEKIDSINEWIPYTNDENKANGWKIYNGLLFQQEGNMDDIPFGERFLIKKDILDINKIVFPIQATIDIYPYDYVSNSEIWFGILFFVNDQAPDKNDLVIALKNNESLKQCGLNIAIGGKAWINSEDNISTSTLLWHWHRIIVQIDKKDKMLIVNAKSWLHENQEPDKWIVSCSIDLNKFQIDGKGVAIGTNAHYGWKTHNPRAFFDNLYITNDISNKFVFPTKSNKDNNELRNLMFTELEQAYKSNIFDLYILFSERFIEYCSDYQKIPDLLFYKMLALRKLAKWEEARKTANLLIKNYPNSKYALMMGGINGKTEDNAAFDFAKINLLYSKSNFIECSESIYKFINDYPNNWRKKESFYKLCYCYYHMKNDEFFLIGQIYF